MADADLGPGASLPPLRIDPAGAPPTGNAPTGDPASFQRLLERLEHLTRSSKPAPVQDAGDLPAAMRAAAAGFSDAMSLRRQLEQAFRARTQ